MEKYMKLIIEFKDERTKTLNDAYGWCNETHFRYTTHKSKKYHDIDLSQVAVVHFL